jgi:hypothetical protein
MELEAVDGLRGENNENTSGTLVVCHGCHQFNSRFCWWPLDE